MVCLCLNPDVQRTKERSESGLCTEISSIKITSSVFSALKAIYLRRISTLFAFFIFQTVCMLCSPILGNKLFLSVVVFGFSALLEANIFFWKTFDILALFLKCSEFHF